MPSVPSAVAPSAKTTARPRAHAPAGLSRDPRVDDYIARAPGFAQPILLHLREQVHAAVPEVEESIKWSMPFFSHRGVILGNMAAFKQHCSFGLWNENVAAAREEAGAEPRGSGLGSFGKIASLDGLPKPETLRPLIRQAAAKIEDGTRTKAWAGRLKQDRAEPELPEALAAALRGYKAAAAKFEAMSPSCRREYCEWIADAKRDETRSRRLTQAMEWIAEGKHRNWQYQTKTG